jgi:polysaccharide biosynthesis transport protein
VRRIVASVQTDLKRAVQQEQDLSARLAQLKVRSGDVNVDLVSLRELEREAAAKRAVYEGYLLRAKETGEQRDINTANMSVISQAYPPIDPTGPSRVTITLGGMILGFIAGLGLGVLRGIASSLRNAGRSRRRFRATDGAPSANLSAVQSDTAVPEFRDPEPLPADPEIATEEATMNPLARLMERMRRPAPADKADAVPASSAPAEAGRSSQNPYMNAPGAEPRVNEEPAAMYPYPQQPQAYPQAPYPYAPPLPYQQPQPAPQFQQGQPQPQFQQAQPQPQFQQAPQFQQPQPAPQFQQAQPAPQFQQPQPAYSPQYAQPQQYPPHFAPQPAAYPYPPQPPQPAFHAWQQQSVPYDPYGRPQQVASPYPAYPMMAPPAPAPAYPQAAQPAYAPAAEAYPASSPREMSPIEEVRESLREFRDAIRDLTDSRSRRSY